MSRAWGTIATAAAALAAVAAHGSVAAQAAEGEARHVLVFDLVPVAEPPAAAADAEAVAAAETVTGALLEALRGRREIAAVGRGEMEAMLRFAGLQQSLQCADERCRGGVADALQATHWLTGTLRRAGPAWVLGLAATDGGRPAGSETVTGFTVEEVVAQTPAAAARLLALPSRAAPVAPTFALEASADGTPTKVAVIEVQAGHLSPEDRQGLSEVIAVVLRGMPDLSVISKDDIQRMLEFESQRQLLGCDDESCLAEIGGALGVQYLVAGNVARLGDTTVVTLKLIDIRSAVTAHRVAESFAGDAAQLLSAVRHGVLRLLGRGLDARGALRVDGSEADLRLQVDGAAMAASDLAALPVGRHSLRLETDDTFPWFGDVYIRDDQPVVVRAVLEERPTPWYRTWWFWSTLAVVAAGAATTAGVVLATQPSAATLNLHAATPLGGP